VFVRAQELLRRSERARGEAGLFQQALQGTSHQIVVVDDGDEGGIPLHGHGYNTLRAGGARAIIRSY
jgi:predicted phosphoribosyltransferase